MSGDTIEGLRRELDAALRREEDALGEIARCDRTIVALAAEMERQDAKHGPFEGSRLGRSRLALACIDDELREAEQAWRDERKATVWDEARTEVLQVAAVAMRALRDAFPPGVADDEEAPPVSDLTYDQYIKTRAAMTDEQWQRVKDKCSWEHMTPWQVLNEWPSLRPSSRRERFAIPVDDGVEASSVE